MLGNNIVIFVLLGLLQLYHAGACCTDKCEKESLLPYHKLLTPQYIQDHAAINHLVSASPGSLHFKEGQTNGRLIRFPIFQKGQLCTNDDIVVYVKVFLLDPPTSDSDPLVSICDGKTCNGMFISDSGNYPANACIYGTFNSGPVLTGSSFSGSCGGIPITYTKFPNAATLTFYPSQNLGTFHIVPDGGYTTVGPFTKTVDPTQGLFLEIYGNNPNEQYRIQYIQVEVKAN